MTYPSPEGDITTNLTHHENQKKLKLHYGLLTIVIMDLSSGILNTQKLKLLGAELRGIFDPLYKFLIALANPAASYGDCARRIQNELEQQLRRKLRDIGDEDFREREYYIEKWGFELERNNINYWSFMEGEGKVQSPRSYTK